MLAATVASAQEGSLPGLYPEDDPLAGTWRVESFDRFGAKRELLTFSPRPGFPGLYDYIRRDLERVRGKNTTRERGEAELTRRWFTTRQHASAEYGLVSMFRDPNELLVPQLRDGLYKLGRKGKKAKGFSSYPGTLRIAKERLVRVGDDDRHDGRGRDNNHVELLVDGREFFPRLREALEGARTSICLQTFIFTEDRSGRRVGRILIDKAREGVQVRVLVDAVNSKISRSMRKEMRDAGVELIIQHGWGESIGGAFANMGSDLWNGLKGLFGGRKKPRERRGIFNHDHRKITVVDGRVGFCGGMNIAHEYEEVWHDVQARVEGDAVRDLEELFYDRWKAAGGALVDLPPPAPVVLEADYWPGDQRVDVVATLPGVRTDIRRRYENEIDDARRRVWIECAYFLDDHIIKKLRRRAQEGLDVAVIIPDDEVHDVSVVRDAFSWVQNDIVRSGIRLYKYRDRMVHAKVAAFDGRLATVGSSNLDVIALQDLAEANLFVDDPQFARTLERRVFETDFPRSGRVQVEKSSWWKKIKGGVLHFFRNLL